VSHPINEQIKDTVNDQLDNLTVSELQSMVETLGMNSVVLDDFLRDVAEQMYEQLHLKL
jgi:hypothetical protein|tara:strand:+ start:430 stop:606 length:177 start_codon:yes stop_codon:yes gene_type:complete